MSYHVYYHGELSITPPLSEADAAIVTAFFNGEKNGLFDRAVQNKEETDALWLTGMLAVSDDRDLLFPVEDESSPGLDVWLRLVQDHFMAANGYALNGQIVWTPKNRQTGEPSSSTTCHRDRQRLHPQSRTELGSRPLRQSKGD